jgi:hypothetical protein
MAAGQDKEERINPGVLDAHQCDRMELAPSLTAAPYLPVSAPIWLPARVHPPQKNQMIGAPDMANIIRLQLALMKPKVSDIRIHVDTGGYATYAHRLHIPLMTNPGVNFDLCPFKDEAKTQQVGSRAGAAGREMGLLYLFGDPVCWYCGVCVFAECQLLGTADVCVLHFSQNAIE